MAGRGRAEDPLKTTTYGTGELIKAALGQGCMRLIIGSAGLPLRIAAPAWPRPWASASCEGWADGGGPHDRGADGRG